MITSLNAIWAIILRLLPAFRRDFNLFFSTFYWTFFDIIFWGFLGMWIQQSQPLLSNNYKMVALVSLLLWQFIARGCHVIISGFIEELWSQNIVNLFSLPLRLIEWILGLILFTAFIMTTLLLFGTTIIYYVYDIPIIPFIKTVLTFTPPLFLSSIWVGFTCLSVIIFLGKRGIELGYIIVWTLLPFSGAYYPTNVLPHWAQQVSEWLPMHHIFSGVRQSLMHHEDPTPYLARGYTLSTLYALGAILLFMYCFKRAKNKGLARLIE